MGLFIGLIAISDDVLQNQFFGRISALLKWLGASEKKTGAPVSYHVSGVGVDGEGVVGW